MFSKNLLCASVIPLLSLSFSLHSCSGQKQSHETRIKTEICIYGATPGGIAAALAAAKSGRQVMLLEPTGQVGGMITSGLSHSDFHSFESLSGTYLEFSNRVKKHYKTTFGPDSPQVEDCFEGTFAEPKVNLQVLETMMAEYPNITIYTQAVLTGVKVNGADISASTFSFPQGALTVSAAVFIDGSYEGDLMAMAGVPYHVGREGRDVYGESLAPETSDQQLQGYNFRFCATDVPENRAPVLMPKGYHRQDFLDLLPILESGKITKVFCFPSGCLFKAHTPPLPNGKYDVNDVSNGLVRLSMPGHNLEWPEGDISQRKEIFEEHLRYNVGLLYFLQNDKSVPSHYQEEAREWGWCLDEFVDNGHLPPQLYVREARRMIGEHIYTQQDSEYAPGDSRALFHPESIAMGDYGNNCHGTRHEGPLIGGKHAGEFYNPTPPYQIPYGVLLPRKVKNLLVPVAVSSSHVGFSALRLEPIWISLGQAAGHAAALAMEHHLPVQEVDVPLLQERLHRDGSSTVYVSDVLPGDKDFIAVQWWGSKGGLHGLETKPASGPRGKKIHGQYFEAAPGHQLKPDNKLDGQILSRWLKIADEVGISSESLENTKTRGAFIRAAYSAYEKQDIHPNHPR